MKKFLLVAAAASAALAGCVSNEAEISSSADSKIAFTAPLVTSTTRAYVSGEIKNAYPTGESFVVSAKYYDSAFTTWNAGQNYMTAVQVNHKPTDNAWAPDQDYYWPKNGTLTFFAYSPADYSTWKPAIDAAESLTASAVTVVAADADLLYSSLAKDQTKTTATGNDYYSGVDIMFHHALSSIVFKTRLTGDFPGTTITVNEVKLSDVKSQGNFAWDLNVENAPVWSDQAEVKEYTAVTGASQVVASGDAAELTDANPLILLPQTLTDAVATVKYTIQNEGQAAIAQTATVELADLKYGTQANAEWLPGKRYIYTINFGLDRIVFAPQVKNWEDVEVTE